MALDFATQMGLRQPNYSLGGLATGNMGLQTQPVPYSGGIQQPASPQQPLASPYAGLGNFFSGGGTPTYTPGVGGIAGGPSGIPTGTPTNLNTSGNYGPQVLGQLGTGGGAPGGVQGLPGGGSGAAAAQFRNNPLGGGSGPGGEVANWSLNQAQPMIQGWASADPSQKAAWLKSGALSNALYNNPQLQQQLGFSNWQDVAGTINGLFGGNLGGNPYDVNSPAWTRLGGTAGSMGTPWAGIDQTTGNLGGGTTIGGMAGGGIGTQQNFMPPSMFGGQFSGGQVPQGGQSPFANTSIPNQNAPNYPLNVGAYLNPATNFMQQQALKGLQGTYAGQGDLLSGNAMKGITDYLGNMSLGQAWNPAVQTAQQQQGFGYGVNAADRAFAEQQQLLNQTVPFQQQMQLAQLGLQGTQGQQSVSNLLATLLGQNAIAMGNAAGTGTIGGGNAVSNAIQQALANYMGQSLLSRIFPTPTPTG